MYFVYCYICVSMYLSTENKIKILKKEGIQINKGKIEDFENKLYKFS